MTSVHLVLILYKDKVFIFESRDMFWKKKRNLEIHKNLSSWVYVTF